MVRKKDHSAVQTMLESLYIKNYQRSFILRSTSKADIVDIFNKYH